MSNGLARSKSDIKRPEDDDVSKALEQYGLADLMGQSTTDKLNHVASVLSSGQGTLGYEAVSGWLIAHPGDVHPVDYVVLFAEAAVSGVSAEHVEQTHPKAARMAQQLVSHMETRHPGIMAKMPFKFSASHGV
jgi:hypothetical protein